MKQGSASRAVTEGKVEPKPMAIRPGGVGQIGIVIDPKAHEAMHAGRGYKAPVTGSQSHPAGSQGKHR